MESIIVSVEEIGAGTINSDLFSLCKNKPDEVIKLENYIAKKVFSFVDKEQFNGNYPDDLKDATISLVQNLFIFSIQNDNSIAKGRRSSRSEKVDDYSLSENYESYSAYTFFGVPIDKDTLDILEKYKQEEKFGFFNIDLH